MVNFEENMKLVVATYTKYFGSLNFHREDMLQCGYLGLWKACKYYNEKKGYAFSTFAVKCIKNEMAMFLRKELKHWYRTTDYVLTDENGEKTNILEHLGDEKDMKDIENKIYIENVLNVKNGDVLREVLEGDFQKDIGARRGITHQAISKIIKESRAKVREKMQ